MGYTGLFVNHCGKDARIPSKEKPPDIRPTHILNATMLAGKNPPPPPRKQAPQSFSAAVEGPFVLG